MSNGEIGTGRFAWRIGGAAAGAAVGLGTVGGEQAYDGYMYWHKEMSKGLSNYESALRGGWLPR